MKTLIAVAALLVATTFAPAALAQGETAGCIVDPVVTAVEGGEAVATFSVAPECGVVDVSLATYEAPAATRAYPQTLFDSATGSFSAAEPGSLTAPVPDCFHQVDLVTGPVLQSLEDEQYPGFEAGLSGGTHACGQTPAAAPARIEAQAEVEPVNCIVERTLIAEEGGLATATFTVSPACETADVSLVTYKAPAATRAYPQTLFDRVTQRFSGGDSGSLTIAVPDCWFQVDLVTGPVIEYLTDESYPGYVAGFVGGTHSCEATPVVETAVPVETPEFPLVPPVTITAQTPAPTPAPTPPAPTPPTPVPAAPAPPAPEAPAPAPEVTPAPAEVPPAPPVEEAVTPPVVEVAAPPAETPPVV